MKLKNCYLRSHSLIHNLNNINKNKSCEFWCAALYLLCVQYEPKASSYCMCLWDDLRESEIFFLTAV